VIDFQLNDISLYAANCEASMAQGGWPELSLDPEHRLIDVVFPPHEFGCGSDYDPVQGLKGQLWSLEAGDWTLRGPHSSIAFTVVPGFSGPALSIEDVSVIEGDSGATSALFSVRLSAASELPVSVSFATADVTALAGDNDYVPAAGLLTFEPGETLKLITVQVNGDLRDEDFETFHVNLGSPTNASLADGQGLGTILDDDPIPTLTVNDVTQAEGSSGSTAFDFTLSLSAPSEKQVGVYFRTDDGTARAGSDYTPTFGFFHFASGQTALSITVPVSGDTRAATNESFQVRVFHPQNVTIVDGFAVGTIQDDDPPPALAISDVTLAEGRSGITYFAFTVSLSAVSDKTISVNFATANGTATTANNDYAARSGTLTFAPGETTKTIYVQVNGDKKKEANETFFVNLSAAVDAILADGQGLGTILNDD